MRDDASQMYGWANGFVNKGMAKGLSDVEGQFGQTDKGLDSSLGDALWMLGGNNTDDSAMEKASVKPSKTPL